MDGYADMQIDVLSSRYKLRIPPLLVDEAIHRRWQ